MEKLLAKIDELEKEYLDVWQDVCNLESPTGYKEGVDRVGAYFAEMAEKRGFKIEYSRQDIAGDVVCITMNPDSKEAPLVISGHIDTVHPVGFFGSPAVRVDGDKIYGPGVTDCKGGVVAGFMAMDALYRCGYGKRPVRLLLQTDEETGSRTSGGKTIQYICEMSKDAVVFLNLETHTQGWVTLSRKGIVSYRFDVTGIGGHSSRCATEGANAVVEAAHKIVELDRLKDDDGITCNCAIVSGGTVLNTIPDKCSFSVNFRYTTEKQAEWIENFVNELANTSKVPGCSCMVTKVGARPAMELCECNIRILERVNRIFEEIGIPTMEGRQNRGGSDASYITQYGIPCIDSLGTEGGKSHSADEFARISSLSRAAKRIVAIAAEI